MEQDIKKKCVGEFDVARRMRLVEPKFEEERFISDRFQISWK